MPSRAPAPIELPKLCLLGDTSAVQFQVLVEGQPHPVELAFGGERELTLVSGWRAPTTASPNPAVRDTIEFARLAAKRWRYYRRSIATATSLAEFQAAIRRDARAEVSLLLVARADWFPRSSILGLAQCRHTYCHHLILDFLSVHPRIVGGERPRVCGVGSGLVYGLAEFSALHGVPLIWGEATAHSAPFYAKALATPGILDHFFIREQTLDHCRRRFREEFLGQT
jgi:hypothetical protein